MKYLVLYIDTRDGERDHTSKVLLITQCKNINFAAQWYTAHFWGECGIRESKSEWWWWFYDIACRLESVTEITEGEYNVLKKYI